MSAPIKIHNALPSHTLVPLPAHEHAARRRRAEAAGLPGIPGIPRGRSPRQPKPPVGKGRKTVETRNPPLPPFGWGSGKLHL